MELVEFEGGRPKEKLNAGAAPGWGEGQDGMVDVWGVL